MERNLKLAYIAGVFEHKGSFFLSKGSKATKYPYTQLTVKNENIAKAFGEIFEVTPKLKNNGSTVCSLMNRRAVAAATEMKPYFVTNRRKKCAGMMEKIRFFPTNSGRVTAKEAADRRNHSSVMATFMSKEQRSRNYRVRFGKRYRMTPNDERYAFAAGLLDITGWIRNTDTTIPGEVIRYQTTDGEIAKYLWSLFGGKVRVTKGRSVRRPNYIWTVGVVEFRPHIKELLPYMNDKERIERLKYWQTHKMPKKKNAKPEVSVPSRWGSMFQ